MKKDEYLTMMKNMGNEVDIDYLNKLEENGEVTPWLQELITKHSGDIQTKFQELLNLKFKAQVSIILY